MLKHQETYLESYWSSQSWLVSTDKANRGKQSIWTAPIHENWTKTEAFVQITRLGQAFGTHCVHKSLRILVTLNHFVLTSLTMIVCFKCCSDGGFCRLRCVFNDTFEYIYFLCKIQREFSPFAQASTSNANWRVPEARLELDGSLKFPLKRKFTWPSTYGWAVDNGTK